MGQLDWLLRRRTGTRNLALVVLVLFGGIAALLAWDRSEWSPVGMLVVGIVAAAVILLIGSVDVEERRELTVHENDWRGRGDVAQRELRSLASRVEWAGRDEEGFGRSLQPVLSGLARSRLQRLRNLSLDAPEDDAAVRAALGPRLYRAVKAKHHSTVDIAELHDHLDRLERL